MCFHIIDHTAAVRLGGKFHVCLIHHQQHVLRKGICECLQLPDRHIRSGRVIRIDDNNRFCAVGDLLSHIIDVRIPFGLFVADVVDGFSAGQRCAGSPERVIRGWDEDFIPVIQKSGHTEVDQLTDAVSCINIINRNIWQFL